MWKNMHFKTDGQMGLAYLNALAKLIVWLAMEQEPSDKFSDCCEELEQHFFGGTKAGFSNFCREYWEHSPGLLQSFLVKNEKNGKFFSKILQTGNIRDLLNELLTGALNCPPVVSDELEPSGIFNDIKGRLGQPLIFGEDIRILRSVSSKVDPSFCNNLRNGVEEVYHDNVFGGASSCLSADVETCLHAYELGYTIALRGMEFRCREVATMADSLATYFGQATVGANIYLTPPNAQGLTLHYDDHCVLVCQLAGRKKWKIYPPTQPLPRLYSQKRIAQDVYNQDVTVRAFLLIAGDSLYIPRGFLHEADTKLSLQEWQKHTSESFSLCSDTKRDRTIDGCAKASDFICPFDRELSEFVECGVKKDFECSSLASLKVSKGILQCQCMNHSFECDGKIAGVGQYSLHITFGVEVEPPFEWEGLLHISLHHWSGQQNWEDIFGQRDFPGGQRRLGELCTGLLHVAIRDCGNRDSAFRKACMVAAKPFRGSFEHSLYCQEKGFGVTELRDTCQTFERRFLFEQVFRSLIAVVDGNANFQIALEIVLCAINNAEGIDLRWASWLRHLPCTDKKIGLSSFWSEPVAYFDAALKESQSEQSTLELEAAFTEVKSTFVSKVMFRETCNMFEFLLNRYRNIRKRFINGMLTLHCQ